MHRCLDLACVFILGAEVEQKTAALGSITQSRAVTVERDEKLVGNNSVALTLKVVEKWM